MMPEFSLTVTGAPIISLRKPLGSRESVCGSASLPGVPLGSAVTILDGVEAGDGVSCDMISRELRVVVSR